MSFYRNCVLNAFIVTFTSILFSCGSIEKVSNDFLTMLADGGNNTSQVAQQRDKNHKINFDGAYSKVNTNTDSQFLDQAYGSILFPLQVAMIEFTLVFYFGDVVGLCVTVKNGKSKIKILSTTCAELSQSIN